MTAISAVPVSEMLQDQARTVPDARALQVIVDPLSVPCAVPESFRSPGHVALNAPFALVPVCSVTFHLKSVHEPGVGMMLDDQLPNSVPMPAAEDLASALPFESEARR